MDPYEILAEHPDISLTFAPLPPGERGRWYPDLHAIVIDSGLNQAERRCTLMHELVHRMRGDTHVEDVLLRTRQERSCHASAARCLIPLDRLRAAMQFSRDPEELAQELWVDVETLLTRVQNLDVHEAAFVMGDLEETSAWGVA